MWRLRKRTSVGGQPGASHRKDIASAAQDDVPCVQQVWETGGCQTVRHVSMLQRYSGPQSPVGIRCYWAQEAMSLGRWAPIDSACPGTLPSTERLLMSKRRARGSSHALAELSLAVHGLAGRDELVACGQVMAGDGVSNQ